MTMLKAISVAIFLAGCMALYLAVLMVINPTFPGASNFIDTRVAYSITILLLALVCCVVSGLTWSYGSAVRPSVAVYTALSLWLVLLVIVCVALATGDRIPL